VLVALKNGEIMMFNDKHHIDTISMNEPVHAMKFGIFGREEGCLIVNTASGGIFVKILQRQSNFNSSSIRPGPPVE
jgi:Bardet-Biedl syndrome 1 protein